MSLPDYDEVSAALKRLGSGSTAAELHGILCGVLSVLPAELAEAAVLAGSDLRDLPRDPEARSTFQQLREGTLENLTSDELSFAPLLPDDEQPLGLRAQALGHWCQGFLYGLSQRASLELKELSEEVREVIGDFSQFTSAGFDEADDEEMEESAYAELVEYVRVGAQLVFLEMNPRAAGGAVTDVNTPPTLH